MDERVDSRFVDTFVLRALELIKTQPKDEQVEYYKELIEATKTARWARQIEVIRDCMHFVNQFILCIFLSPMLLLCGFIAWLFIFTEILYPVSNKVWTAQNQISYLAGRFTHLGCQYLEWMHKEAESTWWLVEMWKKQLYWLFYIFLYPCK